MARIDGVPTTTKNPIYRLIFWLVRRRFGRDVEPLRGCAANGAVFAATTLLELAMEHAHKLEGRLPVLAELRVAALVGCPFCLDIGSMLGDRVGISAQQIRDLNTYEDSPAFSDLEKAVLRFTDPASRTPVAIDEDNFRWLRGRLDDAQLVELTARIGHENLRARMNHALGYGAQGFSRGVCALPAASASPRTAA